jgi:ribonuclease R
VAQRHFGVRTVKTKSKKQPSLPTREEVLAFIEGSKTQVGKREIARAFGLKGSDKIALKAILKDLKLTGAVARGHGRRVGREGALADIEPLEITAMDSDGDLFARPVKWESDAAPPKILVHQPKQQRGKGRERRFTVGVGDRILAKIAAAGDDAYEARPIKKLAAAPQRLLGVYEETSSTHGGRLRPVDKRYRAEVAIAARDVGPAKPGDLVAVDVFDQPRHGPERARVVECLGRVDAASNLSLIAIHTFGLQHIFSEAALTQAKRSGPAPLGDRVDLRELPLVTIDGEDARDFDDAVFAEPDPNPENPGGWHLVVAIADVAWYVRPGDALDRDAFARGNSVYFPDRVVPMLPEELSNGWCSLKPHEDRPCMVAHMWISEQGKLLRHKFVRALMRSQARLTYTQVQAARDGTPDEITRPLMKNVIAPLYAAYAALDRARSKRGTLELDIVERKIIVDRKGHIVGVVPRARYDSHKLIEEFMIAANVAAAETLANSAFPAVYRIHDNPDPERVDALREALASVDLNLKPGNPRPSDFNGILAKVRGGPHENLVNTLVLRTQAQAVYSPDNIGHFGLGLRKYAHFTSPIRRYSDLLVHRALIAAGRLGEGGWSRTADPDLTAITDHISATERKAAAAERQTVDRFTAAYLADKAGAVFRGRINGVSRFGVFVSLDETGADGILPMRHLPQDFYDLDERNHRIVGRRRGLTLRVGDVIDVSLFETDEIAGSIVFEYVGRIDKISPVQHVREDRGDAARSRPRHERKSKHRRRR